MVSLIAIGMTCHFILYVRDQEASAIFYQRILNQSPQLNVPGMTEFQLSEECILGLMPEGGIKRLLGEAIPHPAEAKGVPRAELYLVVSNPEEFISRGERAGGRLLSSIQARNWGHRAGYMADPDGHVIAFASRD